MRRSGLPTPARPHFCVFLFLRFLFHRFLVSAFLYSPAPCPLLPARPGFRASLFLHVSVSTLLCSTTLLFLYSPASCFRAFLPRARPFRTLRLPHFSVSPCSCSCTPPPGVPRFLPAPASTLSLFLRFLCATARYPLLPAHSGFPRFLIPPAESAHLCHCEAAARPWQSLS